MWVNEKINVCHWCLPSRSRHHAINISLKSMSRCSWVASGGRTCLAAVSNVLTRWLCQVHCVPSALKDFGRGGRGGKADEKRVTSFRISGYLACGSLAAAPVCMCVGVYRVDEFPLSCSWFLGFYGEFVGQLPLDCNPFATEPLATSTT